LINYHAGKNNDDRQLPATVSEFICLSEEEITMREKQGPLLSSSTECQRETITNIINNFDDDDQQTSNENNLFVSNLSSSSSLTTTTNGNKTSEHLPKENEQEEEEEEKKKEIQRCDDDYYIDEEKKNNSSFVHDDHASGILLINDEPTQTALLQQEKKEKEEGGGGERERPSSPLPTLEQFNQQRTEDESSIQMLSNSLNQITMANIDENEQLYKKVEIEEVPDDEEAILTQNIDSIEPTDFIRTDEEPRKPTQTNITTPIDAPIKFNNVLSCYEKALAKVVDTYDDSLESSNILKTEPTTTQSPENDPIALRALQRFEERMNAVAIKTNKDEINSLATKGKSSWSGSLTTPRKSMENLFKNNEQQLHPTSISIGDESTSQHDSYIRPRKTFDDNSLNYRMALNQSGTSSTIDKTNNDHHKSEEQLYPTAIAENDDKRGERIPNSCLHSFF
jgi:hypothetical protein